ncbi:MFS transporter [Halobacterium zhouii]|uniref:MFS transporter n=1 Tax=Halobacterium zhouii TaxID=2902624 RepID=UPI001E43F6C8|nr:MFS transporter [Halobacterium zhouii]
MAGFNAVRRYYAYLATTAYGFYLPVGLLYLEQQYGWVVVGLTQGVFSFALVAAEIPTGYVGDRIGRRASLALGNVISTGALGAFVFLDSPLEYCALYAVWALGWGFRSGTSEAWLYEFLASRGDTESYTRLDGRARTVRLLVSAAGAVLAGVLVTFGWGVPLFVNAALSALGVPILLSLPAVGATTENDADDPPAGDPKPGDADVFGVRDAVRMLRVQARRPEIRWLVVYVGLFYVLFAVTRPYESPIAEQVGVPVAALGALFAGFKLVSAGAAASAGWVRDAFGTRGVLALLVPVYGVAFASVAFVPLFVLPVFFLNRGLKTVLGPIRNQYVNDRLEDVGRATVLSGVSMLLSVAAGTANLFSGPLIDAFGPFRFLAGAGVAAATAAGVLWVAVDPVREDADSPVGTTPSPATD